MLTTYSDPTALHPNAAQTGWAYGDGTQEIYSRATNTIYASSIWGSYLHPGRRPGTYVYRYAKGAPLTINRPAALTAAQARALRNGTVAIIPVEGTDGVKVRYPGNAPGYAQTPRSTRSTRLNGRSRRLIASALARSAATVV